MTHYMTGYESKLKDGRPSTEPLFSRGTRDKVSPLKKYSKINYVDFIRFCTYNNQQILMSQSVDDNHMQAIFCNHNKYNRRKKQFCVSSSIKEVKEQVEIPTMAGMNIFSFAADQKTRNFHKNMMEDFGKAQTIITEDPEDLFLPGLSVISVTCRRDSI